VLASRSRTLREQQLLGEGERELFALGRAPTVVAFHGFSGTAAELRPLLRALADAGFAVDAALLAGHGLRAELLQEQTFDDWVRAARARAESAARRSGRVVLLGFSLGSLLALELASERPPWLAGLVVLGNAIALRPIVGVPLRLLALAGRRAPDLYLRKPVAGDLVDRAALGDIVSFDRHPVRAAVEVARGGSRVRALVERVACPTLVLHGRRDRVCPWENAVWLARHLGSPDVSVRVFERSAHLVACDLERDEVARETVAFVDRLARA